MRPGSARVAPTSARVTTTDGPAHDSTLSLRPAAISSAVGVLRSTRMPVTALRTIATSVTAFTGWHRCSPRSPTSLTHRCVQALPAQGDARLQSASVVHTAPRTAPRTTTPSRPLALTMPRSSATIARSASTPTPTESRTRKPRKNPIAPPSSNAPRTPCAARVSPSAHTAAPCSARRPFAPTSTATS